MRNERLAWLAVSAFGALVVWYATSNGVGISTDSMSYLRGAESIAHFDGYTMVGENGLQPIDHWPPLYSVAIAIPMVAGVPSTHAVRIVNALAMFVLLYFTATLVRRLSTHGVLAPIVAMIAVLAAPVVLRNHVMAWSESLFIPLILLGLVMMHDYLSKDRMRDLVAAGVCFGLAAVDRYSGAAFIAAIAASLLVRDLKHPAGRRFVRPLVFCAVACLPTALWFARNLMVASRAHDRPFAPRMLSMDHVRAAVDAVTMWFLPKWVPLSVRAVWVLVLVVLLAIVLGGNHGRVLKRMGRELSGRARSWALIGVCVAVYFAFVLASITLFDFEVQFDTRMMSPVYVLVVALAAATGGILLERPFSLTMRAVVVSVFASVMLLVSYSVTYVRAAHRQPAQYAGAGWKNARAWEIVRAAPESVRVYSTSPYVSAYFVARPVEELPQAPAAADESSLTEYRARLRAIAREPGAYVLVYPLMADSGAVLDNEARTMLNARVVDSSDVVVLYRVTE